MEGKCCDTRGAEVLEHSARAKLGARASICGSKLHKKHLCVSLYAFSPCLRIIDFPCRYIDSEYIKGVCNHLKPACQPAEWPQANRK
jgi:hypothetical protein